jgi:hypothetical protein
MGNTAEARKAPSTAEERKRVLEFWVQYIRPGQFKDLVVDGSDGYKNGQQIAAYIEAVHNNHWDPDILSAAVRFLQNNLIGLGVATEEQRKSREEKAKEAAVKQRAEQIDANNKAVLANWLEQECPLGLLVNGTLYPSTLDKIIACLDKNHSNNSGEMILTPAMLSAAVTTLSNSLDYFSEDRVLRNQPPPKSRGQILHEKLSEKAKREAGMLPPERLKGHREDGKLTDPNEVMRKIASKLSRNVNDPDEAAAMNILIQDRRGRIDRGKIEQMRSKVIRNPRTGETNWAATRKIWNDFADRAEREKNKI